MAILGKNAHAKKDTMQINSPCGHGCLCGGCNTCLCNAVILDAFSIYDEDYARNGVMRNNDKDTYY